MSPQVVFQIDLQGESFCAKSALIELTCVYSFMYLQKELIAKWLFAELAVEELSSM